MRQEAKAAKPARNLDELMAGLPKASPEVEARVKAEIAERELAASEAKKVKPTDKTKGKAAIAEMKRILMTPEERAASEAQLREQGLQSFLEPSAVKERLYHGTTAHDDYADEKGQAFQQFTGRPTWLAQEPYTASGYSKGTGSTYPVYAQIKNPLKIGFDANDDAEKAFSLARKLGVDVKHIMEMQNPEKAWEIINHPSFIDAVENAGYDGIQMNEGGYKTYGVFSPSKIKSAIGNRGTYDITDPDITKAEGGLAMQAGGVPTFMKLIKKLTTDIKKAEKAGDLETSLAKRKELNKAIQSGVNDPLMPRAQPLTQAEIRMYAERMAPQVAGELTRGADAKTVAGKSQKQFKREQTLPVDRKVLPGAVDPSAPLPYMTLEDQIDSVLLGLPGDPTLARVSLAGIGDVPFAQAVTQHGGPRYGDKNKLWASNLSAATGLLNAADRASRQFGDAPVIASYMKMPSGFGFAQHYLETLLQYQRPDLLNKAAREALEKDIKAGFVDDGKRVTFPNFPGFDDLGAVAQAAESDSILRKHIAAKLGTSEKYGLRPAADVQFAVSHPELTNLETGASGFTLGELTPGLLTESAHPTYSHDIPGKVLGQTQYPTPYDLLYRDQLDLIRNNPEAPEFSTLKMLGARQKIDEQLVNEINEYQERMRQLLGRKKGGAVKKAEGGPVNLTDLPDEVTPANWREHLQNNVLADARALLGVKDGGVINLDELIEKSLKKKDGGVINLDELIDWTLAKAEHRKMKEGGAVKMADGGQTFPLQRPEEVTDLKPRPRTKRDELLEMLSKGVGSVHEFMAKPFGYENPPGEMVSSLIGLPGAAKTLERMAYGDPLTSGAGMTTNLLPETTEAAMLALGAAPTVLKATKNLPVGLSIKPKGGNWLTGDIEQALKPLRSRVIGEEPAERLKKLEDYFADQRAKGVALDYSALDRERARMAPDVAINRWIDTKLNKYIRNEMATPEDPVRALAEQGVTHLPFDVNNYAEIMLTGRLGLDRMRAGFPVHGMGETPAARVWERATDATIRPRTAGEQLRAEYPFNAETMPWLEKLDPETPVYSIPSVSSSDLGFEHLIDELKTAMSPTSDLPNNLRFDPKDIDKLTVPQAVERVSKINAWRAEQAVKAEREGMMANLKAEPRLADESLQLSFVEKPGGAWVDIPETVNKEGVQLCTSIGKAGGWCTMHDERALDYGSGENRLTALLDTEGRPHAQAKITKNEWPVSGEGFAQLDSGTKAQYRQYVREWRQRNPEIEELTDEDVIQALKEAGVRGPLPDITELKPPGNSFGSKRSQEYIKRDPEYRQKVANSVLNFLNSGEWGHVSDLDHYNIIDLQSPSNVKNALADNLLYDLDFQRADKFNAASEANPNAPRFMTQEQFRDFLGDLGPTGFAKGGGVKRRNGVTKADLEREYRMAFGGGVFNTDPDITDSGRIIPHNI
jgi:hypothetical protein